MSRSPERPRWRAWLAARFDAMLRRARSDPDGVVRIGARQIYILPTRFGLVFGAVLLVMLLGSLNYQNNLGLLFTFFLAAVALLAMHHAWFNLLGLELQARPGAAVFAGESARFTLSVRGRGRRTRADLRLSGAEDAAAPLAVPAGEQSGCALVVTTRRRGWQPLGEVRVETCHPLGLFRAWCHTLPRAASLVYPAPASLAPPPPGAGAGARALPRGAGAGLEDYAGARDYRHGDSPRHLDWKAYARERGLLTKQFEGEQGHELWIDWAALATVDPETRLAELARQLLDAAAAGARFGLRLPGVEEPLAAGEAQLQRCLTRLALFGLEGGDGH
ncbi:DUF58 domain-containing protein [Marichromatium sp. AB32]|uniref:DUF58 domain-containing protein n=1 Tax=Marichromatium sp. AB32 TaxID=2483363 RepID=UPI000F3CBB35|nr:DUF58 domain-containing protein [Marichromatium sp. AB32]RNE93841.1 DUF58 domain-containing protein [Marichromatium sp. AB32]